MKEQVVKKGNLFCQHVWGKQVTQTTDRYTCIKCGKEIWLVGKEEEE